VVRVFAVSLRLQKGKNMKNYFKLFGVLAIALNATTALAGFKVVPADYNKADKPNRKISSVSVFFGLNMCGSNGDSSWKVNSIYYAMGSKDGPMVELGIEPLAEGAKGQGTVYLSGQDLAFAPLVEVGKKITFQCGPDGKPFRIAL